MQPNECNAPAAPRGSAAYVRVGAIALTLLIGGCATQSGSSTAGGDAAQEAAQAAAAVDNPSNMVATSFGKGTYSDGDRSTVSFAYDSELSSAGEYKGFFRHSGSYGDGRIDLSGTVTCVGFDHPEGRAWIAGTIDKNDSTVDFAGPGTLPVGAVAGFVVEDASVALIGHIQFPQPLAGNDQAAARRFCEKRKWSDEALYPLTSGTLGVFP